MAYVKVLGFTTRTLRSRLRPLSRKRPNYTSEQIVHILIMIALFSRMLINLSETNLSAQLIPLISPNPRKFCYSHFIDRRTEAEGGYEAY